MDDDIKDRLTETSQSCIKSFEAWSANKKDKEAREALQEAIHELRKVSSRLEIELAISERNEMSSKPIPIPTHRDAQKREAHASGHDGFDDDGFGGQNDQQPKVQRKRRVPRRKPPE